MDRLIIQHTKWRCIGNIYSVYCMCRMKRVLLPPIASNRGSLSRTQIFKFILLSMYRKSRADDTHTQTCLACNGRIWGNLIFFVRDLFVLPIISRAIEGTIPQYSTNNIHEKYTVSAARSTLHSAFFFLLVKTNNFHSLSILIFNWIFTANDLGNLSSWSILHTWHTRQEL